MNIVSTRQQPTDRRRDRVNVLVVEDNVDIGDARLMSWLMGIALTGV